MEVPHLMFSTFGQSYLSSPQSNLKQILSSACLWWEFYANGFRTLVAFANRYQKLVSKVATTFLACLCESLIYCRYRQILGQVSKRPVPIISVRFNDPFLLCCSSFHRFLIAYNGKIFVTSIIHLTDLHDTCR